MQHLTVTNQPFPKFAHQSRLALSRNANVFIWWQSTSWVGSVIMACKPPEHRHLHSVRTSGLITNSLIGFNDEALVSLPTAPTLIRWFGMLTSSRPLAITPVERVNYVDCLLFSCEVPDDARPLDDSTVLMRGDYACCYASPTGGESFPRRKPDVLTLDASSRLWGDF